MSPSSCAKHPGGLFQLTLSLAPKDALYDCPGGSEDRELGRPEPANQEDGDS